MHVEVHWHELQGHDDVRWDRNRVLYAYTVGDDYLVYVGRSYGPTSSVRERWRASEKWIHRQVTDHVLIGVLQVARTSPQIVADTENLLIKRLTPIMNGRWERITRPSMRVSCFGSPWFWQNEFRYAA